MTELEVDHNLEASEIFHPSQETYIGLPPLPERYASLILPYDWHLPGKEQRRKRKHRKSHGVISFHDLSARVAHAWKDVDGEVKTYCAQVAAVGMLRYKAAMKVWKQNGGKRADAEKSRRRMMRMMAINNSTTHGPGRMNIDDECRPKKPQAPVPSAVLSDQKMPARGDCAKPSDLTLGGASKDPIPPPSVSEDFTLEEMNRAFENELQPLEEGNEEICDVKEQPPVHVPSLPSTSADTARKASSNEVDAMVSRNNPRSSPVSNVDMADSEILRMWNNEQSGSTQNSNAPDSGSNESSERTMENIQRMKAALQQQLVELERVKRLTMAPPSA